VGLPTAPDGADTIGGDRAKSTLEATKDRLAVHSAAVMTVLFLVIGVNLIGDGLPGLGG
jgi:hypothetical protein